MLYVPLVAVCLTALGSLKMTSYASQSTSTLVTTNVSNAVDPLYHQFKQVTDLCLACVRPCQTLDEAVEAAARQLFPSSSDAAHAVPLSDTELQETWSSKLMFLVLQEQGIILNDVAQLEQQFAATQAFTQDEVGLLELPLKLVVFSVLHKLREFSYRMGPTIDMAFDESKGAAEIQDWHDLMLVLGMYHPFLLPEVLRLASWFSTRSQSQSSSNSSAQPSLSSWGPSVNVKSIEKHSRWNQGYVDLAANGLHLRWHDNVAIHFLLERPRLGLCPDFLALKRFAVTFALPGVALRIKLVGVSHHESTARMTCADPPTLAKQDIPVALESDSLLTFYMKLMDNTPTTDPSSVAQFEGSDIIRDGQFMAKQLEQFLAKSMGSSLAQGIARQAFGLSVHEETWKEFHQRVLRGCLVGLEVSIEPGHAIGWLFDFSRRHLYVTNRGHHLVVAGVLRYPLRRNPTEAEWHRLYDLSQGVKSLSIADYDALLKGLILPGAAVKLVRILSPQPSGICNLRAHLELLRLVLELTTDPIQAKQIYGQVVSRLYQEMWQTMQKAKNRLTQKSVDVAQTMALITAADRLHDDVFSFLRQSHADWYAKARVPYVLLTNEEKVSTDVLLQSRCSFFLRYQRMATLVRVVGVCNCPISRLENGLVQTKDGTILNLSHGELMRRIRRDKVRKWRQYHTIGDEYLEAAVDSKNLALFHPYFVVLGMLLLNRSKGLTDFVSTLTEDQREEIRQLSSLKGYTLFDALIYGQLGHPNANPQSDPMAGIVPYTTPAIFQCLYELQYGSDLAMWTRTAKVPLLADGHLSHILINVVNGADDWTPRLVLYILSVFNQQPQTFTQTGHQLLYHVRNALERSASLKALQDESLEGKLIREHVLPAIKASSSVSTVLMTVRAVASQKPWYDDGGLLLPLVSADADLIDLTRRSFFSYVPFLSTQLGCNYLRSLRRAIRSMLQQPSAIGQEVVSQSLAKVMTALHESVRGMDNLVTVQEFKTLGALQFSGQSQASDFVPSVVSAVLDGCMRHVLSEHFDQFLKANDPDAARLKVFFTLTPNSLKPYFEAISDSKLTDYVSIKQSGGALYSLVTDLSRQLYEVFLAPSSLPATPTSVASYSKWWEACCKVLEFDSTQGPFVIHRSCDTQDKLQEYFDRLREERENDRLFALVMDSTSKSPDQVIAEHIAGLDTSSTKDTAIRVHKYVVERAIQKLIGSWQHFAKHETVPVDFADYLDKWRRFVSQYQDPFSLFSGDLFRSAQSAQLCPNYFELHQRFLALQKKYSLPIFGDCLDVVFSLLKEDLGPVIKFTQSMILACRPEHNVQQDVNDLASKLAHSGLDSKSTYAAYVQSLNLGNPCFQRVKVWPVLMQSPTPVLWVALHSDEVVKRAESGEFESQVLGFYPGYPDPDLVDTVRIQLPYQHGIPLFPKFVIVYRTDNEQSDKRQWHMNTLLMQ